MGCASRLGASRRYKDLGLVEGEKDAEENGVGNCGIGFAGGAVGGAGAACGDGDVEL